MGASSGMGKELAQLFYDAGWNVGIAARRIDYLNTWREENLSGNFPASNGSQARTSTIHTAQIDVCSDDAPARLHDLIERMGGVDLYLHVSGVGKINQELEEDIELNTVNTNGMGFVRMVGAAYRYMAAHGGGHIAVISSIAGTKGLGPAPAYSATKSMQNIYIQSLEQLANSRKLNIKFTDLRPGFVDTPLLNGGSYPLMMNQKMVATNMFHAILRHDHVRVIDWRWSVLVALWKLVPNWIWRRIPLKR